MLEHFWKLRSDERELLLKAPALIALYTAGEDGKVDPEEREEAIRLSHLRTFTAEPLLQDYYAKVEPEFEKDFDELNQELPENLEERRRAIREKLKKIGRILEKIDFKTAYALKQSLDTYGNMVARAKGNVFEYFLIPLNVKGMTE